MVDGRITSEEHEQQFQEQKEDRELKVVEELLHNPEREALRNYFKENFGSIISDAKGRSPRFAAGSIDLPLVDEERLFAMEAIEAILHGNLTEDQL